MVPKVFELLKFGYAAFWTIPLSFGFGFCVTFDHGIHLTVFFVSSDGSIATLILALIGKFATAAGFKAVYQLSIEFFPTVTRTAGLGSCSCVARIGGIISPLVADLVNTVDSRYLDFGYLE